MKIKNQNWNNNNDNNSNNNDNNNNNNNDDDFCVFVYGVISVARVFLLRLFC